jgi:hypothetical protein
VSLQALMSCSIASTGFRVRDYALKETAILKEGQGRTGTNVTIDVEGEVSGATVEELGDNLQAFYAAARAARRRDFSLVGNGKTEYTLSAARVIDGGPWLENLHAQKQLPESTGVKAVSFTIRGTLAGDESEEDDPDGGASPASVKVATETRADKPRKVSYSGTFTGEGSTARFTTYADAQRAAYPREKWVQSREVNSTYSDKHVEFTVRYVELATPIIPNPGRFTIVEMERTTRKDRDEKGRLVVTEEFDVLLQPGDDVDDAIRVLRTLITNVAPPPVILRESSSYTVHRELRVRCSFTILKGSEGSDLLDWDQSIETPNPSGENRSPVKGFEFIGRSPILVRSVIPICRYVQSGSAVGINRYPKPPRPFWDQDRLAEDPVMTRTLVNLIERKVTWRYVFIASRPLNFAEGDATQLRRPETPEWLPGEA